MLFKKTALVVLLGSTLLFACAANEAEGSTDDRIEIVETAEGRIVRAHDETGAVTTEIIVGRDTTTIVREGIVTASIPSSVEPPTASAGNVKIQAIDCGAELGLVAYYCRRGGSLSQCRAQSGFYLMKC